MTGHILHKKREASEKCNGVPRFVVYRVRGGFGGFALCLFVAAHLSELPNQH